jgi:hypothetical protein
MDCADLCRFIRRHDGALVVAIIQASAQNDKSDERPGG